MNGLVNHFSWIHGIGVFLDDLLGALPCSNTRHTRLRLRVFVLPRLNWMLFPFFEQVLVLH